ncbi:SLC13 family permease [Roseomonas alkaliterrae]|uniref:Di/tricarboxylate transporter n=1 Tax=Neoroseomonas alkaliterrae TaxID=1452450 RepID=A0A840XSI9_9PROT|nr:SLC13 family permease [Neoroseomonas alkaliterrae]MBB5691628.1 di/tricarboxylate transporter [Neoroseomonas alkaliterrae]MBR0677343.1 SLC13 family permease [Neoroseomonas alkaliterrae]
MNADLLLVLGLLGAAIVMFVINRPRMDAVGLLMMAMLPFTGVLTMNEAIAGFADPAAVLLALLFVVGEGLVRTGTAQRIGDMLNARAGGNETLLLVLLMVACAGLGSFMSGTAVVAIFIPIALRICHTTGAAPSSLMMPLSVAALISGMMTLVATAPNLVVSAELVRQGHEGFSFFAFTPFGLPILVLAIGCMLVARRLLPDRRPPGTDSHRPPSLRDWVETYALTGRAFRVRILPGSPLVGRRLEQLELRKEGINILAIERQARFDTEIIRPDGTTELRAGDLVLIDARSAPERAQQLREELRVEVLPLEGSDYFFDRRQQIGMVEAIVPPDSPLVGNTVLDARIRAEHRLTVIGLRHGSKPVAEGLLEEKLRAGDTLLLTGFWSDIAKQEADSRGLVVLNMPAERADVLPAAGRAPAAVAILALTVGLMISGWVTNVHAALIGCLLMGVFRCVDLPSAYNAISWKSLVLIVGMLPFSLALQRTGGVELAADAVVALAGSASPRVLLGVIFVITAMLGLFISNTATAVLMAPVALAIAKETGVSPYPFAMTVALAASAAFMTPVSSPVSTLVVGPGDYTFGDFVKIGVPFTVVVLLVTILLVPVVLPP